MIRLEDFIPRTERARLVPGTRGDVLLLSMRRLANLVAYAMTYEFEDVVAEVTGADRVDVGAENVLEWSRRLYKLARFGTRSRLLAQLAAPAPSIVPLKRDYELFFPTFNHAWELYALKTVPDWRKRCRYAACFISEIWVKELPNYLLELLQDFDHIFVGVQTPIPDVARISGRPCSFLPMAANVLTFAPHPNPAARFIDVCNLGRRNDITHKALLKLARERRLTYYYDTVAASGINNKQRTFQVQDFAEHRLLLATLLQRTRFYFANRSRVNEPEFTQGRHEISGRFYEGAASGAVMIGEPPRDEVFEQMFDWPDAVIKVPFECPHIASLLADLEQDAQRLAQISRRNVQFAAQRHDWLHRIKVVYETLSLPMTEGMQRREERLQSLAADVAPEGAVVRPLMPGERAHAYAR